MRWAIGVLVLVLVLFGCLGSSSDARVEQSMESEVGGGDGKTVLLYKTPYCGCCTAYADYLKQNGYEVEVKVVEDISSIKKLYGISPQYSACHTSVVGGYVVEGHVPVEFIEKLLKEKPNVTGILVPGMPPGSPGMGGTYQGFPVYVLEKDGEVKLYGKA